MALFFVDQKWRYADSETAAESPDSRRRLTSPHSGLDCAPSCGRPHIPLNTAGDRAVGDYEFYQVWAGTTPSWTRVAAYQAAGGTIMSVGAC